MANEIALLYSIIELRSVRALPKYEYTECEVGSIGDEDGVTCGPANNDQEGYPGCID